MLIRPFRPDDLGAVIAVFRSNIPKYFRSHEEPELRAYLLTNTDGYFVGEIDERIVAAGGYALNSDQTLSLCWGMVHHDHLHTGLGRQLTAYRLRTGRAHYGDLPVVINTSQLMMGFYEKLGFTLVERGTDGIAKGIDACQMRLEVLDPI